MLRKIVFFILAMGSFSFATAGSIRLINDSVFTLKAIIYANDDSTVGELILEPEMTKYWSDLWGEEGYTEGEQGVYRNYRYSRSPYRVIWLCTTGTEYSLCNDVHTAATVRARDCFGGQLCKPKQEDTAPPQ